MNEFEGINFRSESELFARNETNTILRDKMVGAKFQIHWFVKDCRKEDSRTTLPHKSRAKRVQ